MILISIIVIIISIVIIVIIVIIIIITIIIILIINMIIPCTRLHARRFAVAPYSARKSRSGQPELCELYCWNTHRTGHFNKYLSLKFGISTKEFTGISAEHNNKQTQCQTDNIKQQCTIKQNTLNTLKQNNQAIHNQQPNKLTTIKQSTSNNKKQRKLTTSIRRSWWHPRCSRHLANLKFTFESWNLTYKSRKLIQNSLTNNWMDSLTNFEIT